MVAIKTYIVPKEGKTERRIGGIITSDAPNDVRTSKEAEHATMADRADEAERAKIANQAHELTPDSPTRHEFLSSQHSDTAKGRIQFEAGATYGDYVPGQGGGAILPNGAAELDGLTLRHFLEVPELRYNRVSVQIGNHWRAAGGGIVEHVEPQGVEGIVTVKLEEGERMAIAVDDICQGIFHGSDNATADHDDGRGNFTFAGFATSYFNVVEVLDYHSFRYRLRPTSERWQGQHHPQVGMHFVSYGNFTNTERQRSRYSTRTYERYLNGVNNWEITSAMVAAQFGDLSNLSLFGLKMDGYSAYLNNIYMSGTLQQLEEYPLRMELDTQGQTDLGRGESMQVIARVMRGWDNLTDQMHTWTVTRNSGNSAADLEWDNRKRMERPQGQDYATFTLHYEDIGEQRTIFTFTATGLNSKTTSTIEI